MELVDELAQACGAAARPLLGGRDRLGVEVEGDDLVVESRRMRVTMLPPMRPSPTKPICIRESPLSLVELSHRVRRIARVSDELGRQVVLAQRLEISERLRVLELAEAERLAGISMSASPSTTSERKCPFGLPPLWSWPVECRKRGP